MIKLVVSDMDGTLLDDHRKLHPEVIKVIDALFQKGIRFIPASGRQYGSLRRLWEPLQRDLYYISENGAYVVRGEEDLFVDYIDFDTAAALYDYFQTMPIFCDVFFSTREKVYCLDGATLANYIGVEETTYVEAVDSLADIPEPLIKVCISCDRALWPRVNAEIGAVMNGKLRCTPSGYTYLDFMSPHIHKGYALKKVKELLNIHSDEILCFGDNFNDVEMFDEAKYSYAMLNAETGVKDRASFVTKKDNNNLGALEIIKEYCL